jgi:hypothetical protein
LPLSHHGSLGNYLRTWRNEAAVRDRLLNVAGGSFDSRCLQLSHTRCSANMSHSSQERVPLRFHGLMLSTHADYDSLYTFLTGD